MQISWETIEKAFRLFFPEFSNKVTWAVVIAGLGLTTTSIFQSIINAVLVTQFNIKILGSYDSLIGVLLISLGLTHNILLQREKTKIEVNYKSETNQKAIDHDIALFNKLNEMLDDETLMSFFDDVEVNHAYYSKNLEPLTDFMYEVEKVKISFVIENISKSFDSLVPLTRKLDDFLINNFYIYGPRNPDNYLLCLHPQWNCDRGGRFDDREGDIKYDKAMKELFSIIDDYKTKYSLFRKSVKIELCI
ncbi:hypothetical protein [Psychromonas sp. MME1]|uniref:hypothetical protein n=1 Tax=Psychromonas sp. MME1 TaxID=3231032 RepID=UPI0034E2A036